MEDFKNEKNTMPEHQASEIKSQENEMPKAEKRSTAEEIESRILSSRVIRAKNTPHSEKEMPLPMAEKEQSAEEAPCYQPAQASSEEIEMASQQTAMLIQNEQPQAVSEKTQMQDSSAQENLKAPIASQPMQTAETSQAPINTTTPPCSPRQQFDTTPPLSMQQQASDAEPGNTTTPPKIMPKRKSKTGKYVAISLSAIFGAVLLFSAGAQLGKTITGAGYHSDAASVFGSDDMPMVTVSETPDLDPDNYDVVNGLAGEEIFKKVSPSIVSVVSTNVRTGGGTGSGVIMSEDGYIITNQHVVADSDMVTVILNDGTQIDATIIGTDVKSDLAVLKVNTNEKLIAAEFGDSDALQPGEYAYAIGSPGGIELANTITGGRISAINRDVTIDDRVMTLIQTDASINPGNSGGALINKYGQVVGITSAKLGIGAYEGLGFAIPMSTAKEIVDTLIANGYVAGRPSIGITGYNIPEQNASASNVPQGVYVASVDERAHAATEGLQPKDIITEVNGKTVTTMDEINEIKEACKAGDVLDIKVYRMSEGKFVSLKITLTDEHDLSNENDNTESEEYDDGYYDDYYGDNGYSRYGYGEDPFSYFFGW